ncbi:hypothetical protein F975_01115 [Acinetobacter sp. ANC 3789]|uniref:hypothetical protein n=1 Tax=Acinetobacter sp. ANC 3789 TaxID=1217714 RepID=UPI0002CE3CB2|nr:hypothetical protein [Acinetobacter sp. ANC 3789]ENU81250.1 hypothetical protein F975_01115 [Acinetobacter sp. ANC 3789]
MSSKKSDFSIFLGISLSLFCIGGAVWLLFIGKLAGAEFVALVLGGIVLSLIIYFSSEIQEFSIAGNAVKLRELKDEANQTIESLKQARTELFRLMLPQTLNFGGTWRGSSKVDERVDGFCQLHKAIQSFECTIQLKSDIEKVLRTLIISQYGNLSFIHQMPRKELNDPLDDLWKLQALSLHLTDAMIEAKRKSTIEFIKVKEDIYNAIDVYAKLYVIYKEIMSLPNS